MKFETKIKYGEPNCIKLKFDGPMWNLIEIQWSIWNSIDIQGSKQSKILKLNWDFAWSLITANKNFPLLFY